MIFNRENSTGESPKLPDFQACEQVLGASLHSVMSSYQHGILAACVCAGKGLDDMSWLEGLVDLEDDEPMHKQQARDMLGHLYKIISQQFESINFDFQLLLPDDNEVLNFRLKALGFWCNGFIMGLKALGIHSKQAQVESCKEPLEHIAEIAEIDYEQVDCSEESEKQYLELHEHVRILILTIYYDMAKLRLKQANDISDD